MTNPAPIFLKDYQPPSHAILKINLTFDIFDDHTEVTNVSWFQQLGDSDELQLNGGPSANGKKLDIMAIKLNGQLLDSSSYQVNQKHLILEKLPKDFELTTVCRIFPQDNHTLEGLYKSGSIYCTQNEPEGFRKMTYHLDRPDVMSIYTTTIIGDKAKQPILLSNGNPTEEKELPNNRHQMTWHDPFKKPSYLFALVAGNLARRDDSFITRSGRTISLRIYVDEGNEHRTKHALNSLKKAMRWDEETFGLECDLDIFMIVAVDAFNFGAMENKGLNIFNAASVLADPLSTTDESYERIEGIIGHEYFHNWTGNRVTCRDWFQITLKEGLTVFRDQEFTAAMTDATVKRIKDVSDLREYQFPEDQGPMAHPIRPPSYISINNFYTATVYEKGAEVIRMIHILIGHETFCRGIDKYFELYDGQAVTTDDFLYAMETVSSRSLTQFKRWYETAGTPHITCESSYNAIEKTYTITLTQDCLYPPQKSFSALHMPIKIALLSQTGKPLSPWQNKILEFSQMSQSFTLNEVMEKPILSLLMDFSAPVMVHRDISDQELKLLYQHDPNLFNRYDAGQTLLKRMIRKNIEKDIIDWEELGAILIEHFENSQLNPAYRSVLVAIPSLVALTQGEPSANKDLSASKKPSIFIEGEIDYYELHCERQDFLTSLMQVLVPRIELLYHSLKDIRYDRSQTAINKRKLKNTCLAFLYHAGDYADLFWQQFKESNNMTDTLAAFSLLAHTDSPHRHSALNSFLDRWGKDPLVMNKWFLVQALSQRQDTLKVVKELESHPQFDKLNPNKIRSLLGAFSHNLPHFHHPSGEAYQYISDKVIQIDGFNPMAASFLVEAFSQMKEVTVSQRKKIKSALIKITKSPNLSPNVFEIIGKLLN